MAMQKSARYADAGVTAYCCVCLRPSRLAGHMCRARSPLTHDTVGEDEMLVHYLDV
jgi:hypothetical protein